MVDFTYTAKRQIQGGHTAGVDYTITVDLQAADGGLAEPVADQNVSLSGNVVTVLHRVDRFLSITTDLVPVTGGTPSALDFDEFFSSVAGGETFEYDDGTAQTAIMSGDARVTRQGTYYTYRFKIRLL